MKKKRPLLSVILPVLNEAARLGSTLEAIQALRQRAEIIVVDGGSNDGSLALAERVADRVVQGPRGRAQQMNRGARLARGDYLLFLHGDTLLSPGSRQALFTALEGGAPWGRFDVLLSGKSAPLRVVETLMNLRSRWTGIATGDQGIFVRRDLFHAVGGFPEIPLMEDIALSRRLKEFHRPRCLRPPLITSSRRWESKGILRTILLMWKLRLLFFLGADPAKLARLYD